MKVVEVDYDGQKRDVCIDDKLYEAIRDKGIKEAVSFFLKYGYIRAGYNVDYLTDEIKSSNTSSVKEC